MQGHEALLYPGIALLKRHPSLRCWPSYSDGFPWAYGCAPEQVSASLLVLHLVTNDDWSYLGQFLPGISELGRTVVVGSSSMWKDNYWQSGFLIYADSCVNKGSSVLLLLRRIWTARVCGLFCLRTTVRFTKLSGFRHGKWGRRSEGRRWPL